MSAITTIERRLALELDGLCSDAGKAAEALRAIAEATDAGEIERIDRIAPECRAYLARVSQWVDLVGKTSGDLSALISVSPINGDYPMG